MIRAMTISTTGLFNFLRYIPILSEDSSHSTPAKLLNHNRGNLLMTGDAFFRLHLAHRRFLGKNKGMKET